MKKPRISSKAFEITVEKLVYGGAGIGRHQGKVVFVLCSVPGDRLLVRPVEEKKTFIRAEIVRILKPGKGRVPPVCPYFGDVAVVTGSNWSMPGRSKPSGRSSKRSCTTGSLRRAGFPSS